MADSNLQVSSNDEGFITKKSKNDPTEERTSSLQRSFSFPRDNNTKVTSRRKVYWKQMEGLNPQSNWRKIKRFAHRKPAISQDNTEQTQMMTQDERDGTIDRAGITLIRRCEFNQLPAILLAMMIQRDEKGLPRIPVLLSIVKVQVNRIKDLKTSDKKISRKSRQLQLVVSYGGIQWSIYRRYWDFVKLHYSYCGYDLARARRPVGLPVFPNMILHRFPRHHHDHWQNKSKDQSTFQNEQQQQQQSSTTLYQEGSIKTSQCQNETISTGILNTDDQFTHDNRLAGDHLDDHSIVEASVSHNLHNEEDPHLLTSLASSSSSSSSSSVAISVTEHHHDSQHYYHSDIESLQSIKDEEREYDKLLEQYMMQLISATLHTGNSNRLCKFLEISTLGIYLNATQPYGYHGKEGYMVIVGRTDREPRHSRWKLGSSCFGTVANQNSSNITTSHLKNTPKWFIIRENYMVCVNHPRDMDYYDVFLFEPGFQIQRGYVHHSINKINQLKLAITSAANLSLGHTTLCIRNNAGEIYLRAKNVRQAIQFEQSLMRACSRSTWCLPPQRFNSFAPIRSQCPTTWFVDGNDYFWQISIALENAKHYIYIHDWWLSPELYLRRPPCINEEWRLDNVLKRKADQGVKIYIIVYKEIAMALPLFSHYTKKYLLSLSSNIYVQRHPSRALDIFSKQDTLFYAHHEKICLVDGVVAFIGGLDLCFGRYDTDQHLVTDDPSNPIDQTWIGKDYSNPRIEDFHNLDKPFEDNIDRKRLPRMPWHDISIRICGQAARDVEHHFVQRWNFLRRRKSTAPKRETPMLLPSADSVPNDPAGMDDARIGSQHTSKQTQVQILRSVSTWSTGIETTEHSIMDAYVELIGASKHFIYIENQFFVTSTRCGTTVIENKIGDALYQRILRAHKNKESWCVVIMMPLVPEFPGTFDLADGTTIRLIMNLQYFSIGRGPDSLLGRLRAAGVLHTSNYIKFYGLRNWGELNGSYVTEQVYIHAKTMIVDDKTVVIGSANINERSMLGIRDSEICACIQDTEMIESSFGGQKVKVGRFAHSLRLRLMAEHMGLPIENWDVDMLLANPNKETTKKRKTSQISLGSNTLPNLDAVSCHLQTTDHLEEQQQQNSIGQTTDQQLKHTITKKDLTKTKNQTDDPFTTTTTKQRDAMTMNEESLKLYQEWSSWDTDTDNNGDGFNLVPLALPLLVLSSDHTNDRKTGSGGSPLLTFNSDYYGKNAIRWTEWNDDAYLFTRLRDPLLSQHLWHTRARCNTDLFRRCFMVMPDNNVRSWETYDAFNKLSRRLLAREEDFDMSKARTTVQSLEDSFVLPFIPFLLTKIKGHLVVWPTRFLEDEGDDFLFAMDKLAPLEIFD
ncbi:uncharacterized protein BX664DRAFT_148750 [Halteromyces radiatus]|uniref:uncharacterized protein n=1 Tax=Halteromyces radiatus TaxID=101107 RepID=UPI00221E9A37|nr:uncharacterized protein BX664DRAFT_148750 [Halteromyces radiatus]KAI8086014.1 hypothetical protein BX664DRAFT_148750 [Halteromyces radiatus]